MLRTVNDLHEYQKRMVEFQCSHPASALWVSMGLGKSAATLTSATHLLNCGELRAVVIVAPIRVCRLVWRQEALKWSHTQHLTFSMMVGSKDQRIRALMTKADVYLINYDTLEWLATALQTYYIAHNRPLPFDGIVFDEVTRCKNSSTDRVKALRKVLPNFKWRTGLTGTPASNGFRDLHGQFLVLDDGVRLGTSKTQFETRWYKSEGPYKKVPYADTADRIKDLIGDITIEMSADDYMKMPDLVINDVEVELPEEIQSRYDQLERDFFIKLDSGAEVESFNQASLTNRLLQFSNGNMYPVAGMPLWEPIHSVKLEALTDILEEANGQPVLCFYAYRSDAERIMTRFKGMNPINLSECKSESALNGAMVKWLSGDCPLMICHPASASHGIDGLQKMGNIIVWFGLNWSLELTLQANARLHRQGQGKPVICHRIICKDTMDQAQAMALDEKAVTQAGIRNAVKEYRKMKEKV